MNRDSIYVRGTERPFRESRERVEEMAKQEGFGVLHVHDVQATLAEKGFSAEPTVIVEVCNAPVASKALGLDDKAALLMPCKIVVSERGGEVTVSTILPEPVEGNLSMSALSKQVGEKLMRVVNLAV